jgi:hypothetical protein
VKAISSLRAALVAQSQSQRIRQDLVELLGALHEVIPFEIECHSLSPTALISIIDFGPLHTERLRLT